MDNFTLTINDFSGPLDLLLHLIKESKMDIYSLKIEEITKQYIDYIPEVIRKKSREYFEKHSFEEVKNER